MQGKTIATGKGERDRSVGDLYDTPASCTVALLEFLKLPPCTILEPACGNGYIVNVLQASGYTVISSDIRTGTDYLKIQDDVTLVKALITNPPFLLADAFIEKAAGKYEYVAFLLKAQFWHAKKRYELFNKYPPAWLLPLTWRPDFLEGTPEKSGNPTMDVQWTVWHWGKYNTEYIPLLKP